MNKIVIDSHAFSRLIKGEKRVEQVLDEAGKIFLPVFVVAELLPGFKNGRKEE